MARNRKNQSAAIRFGSVLRAFLLCVAIAGAGIGYVWQKNQIHELGQQMKRREGRLAFLRDLNDKQRGQLARLSLPGSLKERVIELKLGLVPAQPAQTWRLLEPGTDQPAKSREQQFAAERTRTMSAP